jgi:hypothetical protein
MVEESLERGVGDRLVRGEPHGSLGELESHEVVARRVDCFGLNGNTLRWFVLALNPSNGRFLYLNAGIP